MSIIFCGDPHGRFDHLIDAAKRDESASIILLGDMEPKRPMSEELEEILDRVWWIHGNHDADDNQTWERVWGGRLLDRWLHGRVVVLPCGTRVAGLGGVFRGQVWHPDLGDPKYRSRAEHLRSTPKQDRWQGGVTRKHWGTIYPSEIDDLSDSRADILVTHEAPGYHPNGFSILDSLAQAMGVNVTVHGHQHDSIDSSSRWDRQGFSSFGVGLRGLTKIDADGVTEIIRHGELDEVRGHRQQNFDRIEGDKP